MKLKNMIIDNEYDNAFPFDREYTDWINCMEYDYTETGSSLTVTSKVNIVLHKDNEEFSPFSTVNS
ncbi:hypothetical protein UFOVP112_228 [uncultured Caudovirales phage]|uniref:Uncharacterized protein n=1 Tax=uncultured Caudovirales phage TaxID=2100421 RepID=A0A6J5L8R2_9CAUD|nr:hypothetical protein UFOVP112_228 [uncultured Caudovirales phage]